jgi:hypothetical protein
VRYQAASLRASGVAVFAERRVGRFARVSGREEEPVRAFASAPETVDDNRPGARPFALTSRARRHYDVGSRLNASMKWSGTPTIDGRHLSRARLGVRRSSRRRSPSSFAPVPVSA